MLIVRWVLLLLMLAAVVCFGLYIATGQARWRHLGVVIVKWVVLAGLSFFGILILERLALMV